MIKGTVDVWLSRYFNSLLLNIEISGNSCITSPVWFVNIMTCHDMSPNVTMFFERFLVTFGD